MKQQTKIVRIIARLNVGGPARHVIWLTSRLQNQEFQSELIVGNVPPGEEDMGYFADEHGVKPIYVRELTRDLSPKDALSLIKVFGELRRRSPDIVHTHTGKAGTVGRLAAFLYRWLSFGTLVARPRKLRIVHTFHGNFFHSYYGRAKTLFFLVIEKLLAYFATDKIIVISDQQFEEIHEKFGVGRREQFAIVPLGIDLDVYAGRSDMAGLVRHVIGAGENETVVGAVGRLTEIKDIHLLLDAVSLYAEIPGSARPELRFVVIGDGSLRSALEERSRKLGLQDRVTFLGNRTDIPDLLTGIDIVALTSRNEGTPLSLIEGMACGKPVISTAVGGVVDLLGEKKEVFEGFSVCERGIGVWTRQPADFLKGLIYLAKDEKLQESLGEAGREFVRSNYSIDRLEKDIVSLYRELVPADN